VLKEKKDILFTKYKGYAANTALTLWNNWELRNNPHFNFLSGEDIIQEALIKLYTIVEKIDETKSENQIVLFVNTSTKNHVLNEFRRLSGLRKMGKVEHHNVDELFALPEYEESIQKKIVLEFFEKINTNEKKYISLVLDGLTSKEAQQKLYWTDKTLEEKKEHFNTIIEGIVNEYKENKSR